ncbi:hypothetical protein D3C87_1096990 [compost metagenome]
MQVVGGHRADADGQLVIGLVGRIIEGPAGLNGDSGSVAGGIGIDELHRRGEILDVQAHSQWLGQTGPGETENDLALALLDVGRNGRIRQVDHHIAFTLSAPLEVHAANGLACRRNRARRGFGRNGGDDRSRHRAFATLPDHDEQVVAFDARAVRRQLGQIDDQPRAVLGLDHCCAAGVAGAQIAGLAGQLADHARQVDCDPRGRLRGVTTGRRRWLIEPQLQLDAVAWQCCNIQRLEIGRLYHRRQQRYP